MRGVLPEAWLAWTSSVELLGLCLSSQTSVSEGKTGRKEKQVKHLAVVKNTAAVRALQIGELLDWTERNTEQSSTCLC